MLETLVFCLFIIYPDCEQFHSRFRNTRRSSKPHFCWRSIQLAEQYAAVVLSALLLFACTIDVCFEKSGCQVFEVSTWLQVYEIQTKASQSPLRGVSDIHCSSALQCNQASHSRKLIFNPVLMCLSLWMHIDTVSFLQLNHFPGLVLSTFSKKLLECP